MDGVKATARQDEKHLSLLWSGVSSIDGLIVIKLYHGPMFVPISVIIFDVHCHAVLIPKFAIIFQFYQYTQMHCSPTV